MICFGATIWQLLPVEQSGTRERERERSGSRRCRRKLITAARYRRVGRHVQTPSLPPSLLLRPHLDATLPPGSQDLNLMIPKLNYAEGYAKHSGRGRHIKRGREQQEPSHYRCCFSRSPRIPPLAGQTLSKHPALYLPVSQRDGWLTPASKFGNP